MSAINYSDRAKVAFDLNKSGASCAQSVACAFCDMTGLDQETTMKICGTFGGGFRAGEICGVISGAGVVLGMLYPHSQPEDKAAKELISAKIRDFNSRFLDKFPSLDCRDIKGLPAKPEVSPAAQRLDAVRACAVYVVAAVEILEEMIAEDAPKA